MSILITSVFSAYAQMIKLDAKMGKIRTSILERQHLSSRLQGIFLSSKESSFYSKPFPEEKKESLVLIFDNGIDPEPAFSGQILARLFLDSKKRLVLATWPLEKKKKAWRKEILLTNVEDFRLFFLDPTKEEVSWLDRLSKEKGISPPIIRLFVKQNGHPLSFAFFLPSNLPITYKNIPT